MTQAIVNIKLLGKCVVHSNCEDQAQTQRHSLKYVQDTSI